MSVQFTIEEYANNKSRHITARDKFLSEMDAVINWDNLTAMIYPYYYKNRKGRKRVDLETMLKMYLIREWYGLTDKQTEEAIYDSYAFRRFLRLDFTGESVPDSSTLGKFRKMLGNYKLTGKLKETVAQDISSSGYKLTKTKRPEPAVKKTGRKNK